MAGGVPLTEAATVLSATPVAGGTMLRLDAALFGRWALSSLSVLGNCVDASQGETAGSGAEVLGSGDPSQALPRFTLSQAPLAHVAAPGPRGYAPALEIRVGGRLYRPADSLFGEGPDSLLYRTGQRADGKAQVQFAGRLPSGNGNITALYRKGGGVQGNLAPGKLSAIMAPVPGLRSVTNPLTAEGGSDAETADDLRRAAPKAIRVLDRVVSLADAEAFAAGYRGVGKAMASELASGMRRILCLTIATTALAPPVAGSELVADLTDAVLAAAAPGLHLRVAGFDDLPVALEIAMASDPDLRRGDVEAAVRDALALAFGRAAMGFAQGLHRSQVLGAVQAVPGVVAAMLTGFSATRADGSTLAEDAEGRLVPPAPARCWATR